MDKKIIVACSGGPDSMALLDMLYKEKKDIVVCHVNYKKRETANRDEEIVKKYCDDRDIECLVKHPRYNKNKDGNFQSWAREVRYDFFFKSAKKYKAEEIYVAHHMDDHIETYLFQRDRGMLCDSYGLQDNVYMREYRIRRPLLNKTKKQLADYCKKYTIEYGIDESNLTNDYTRNKIRHSKVDYMSMNDKKDYLYLIEKKNEELASLRKTAEKFMKDWDMRLDSLNNRECPWFDLEYYLNFLTGIHYSKKHMIDLIKQLQSDCLIDMDTYYIESFHGRIYLQRKTPVFPISFDRLAYGHYFGFQLKENGETIEGLTVSESDFPLVIRSVQEGDEIQLRIGTKKVSRFFIDRKIPKCKRKRWLVVENSQGKVIFVPGIGCDVEHFSVKPNVFMVQLTS